jgi:subtilisin family serine protease
MILIMTIVVLLLMSTTVLVKASYVNDAQSEQTENNLVELYPWSAKGVDIPKYVPNEILVKFRKPVADGLEEQLLERKAVRALTLSPSLDALNYEHYVADIKPVIKNFKAKRSRIEALWQKDESLLTKREKHLLQRLKRAPAGAKVPELDRIYKLTVQLEPGQSLEDAVEEYNNDPDVEYAELNYIYSLFSTEPNDPNYYPEQWGLSNTGQSYPIPGGGTESGTSDCDIDANEAWDTYTGNSEVIVAVIDTGVDYAHKDLMFNMWTDANGHYGYDTYDEDNVPMDTFGHGTHCSGIIAADGNNGIDVSGVCWNARIMAVRIAHYEIAWADAAEGIEYATDNGADVMSLSWGGSSDSNVVEDAIDYAYGQGVVIVASAGNGDTNTPQYPADYNNVISVAATDANDERAIWSGGSGSNYGSWVDIAAPGDNILSLLGTGTIMSLFTPYLYPPGDPNATMVVSSGTSMACPHVAGACALLLSLNPDLSCDDVNDIIMQSADELDDPNICIYGRLDVNEAILFTSIPSKGHISLERDYYACNNSIDISLVDYDLAGAPQ